MKTFNSVASLKLAKIKAGERVARYYYTHGDAGYWAGTIKTSAQATADGDVIDELFNVTLANGNKWVGDKSKSRSRTIEVFGGGVDATGAQNAAAANTALGNTSIDVLLLDSGYYDFSAPIQLPTNKSIKGMGRRRTRLVAKAGCEAGVILNNNPLQFHMNVTDLSIDCAGIANYGCSFGTGTVIANLISGYIKIENTEIFDAVVANVKFQNCQYSRFRKSISQRGQYGVHVNYGYHIAIQLSEIIDATTTDLWIQNCQTVDVTNTDFFGPFPDSALHYLEIASSNHIFVNRCTFENEVVFTGAVVAINADGGAGNTTDIHFNECFWLGQPFENDLIDVAGSCYDVTFEKCRAIRPSAGKKILRNRSGSNDAVVVVTDCFEQAGYTDITTIMWSDAWVETDPSATTIFRSELEGEPVSFVPQLSFTGGNTGIGVSAQNCHYTVKDRTVHVHYDFTLASLGTDIGGFRVDLPIPAIDQEGGASIGFSTNPLFQKAQLAGGVAGDTIRFRKSDYTEVTDADMTGTDRVMVSVSYMKA